MELAIMKIIQYPFYIISALAVSTMTASAADSADLENFFNTNIKPQMQLCGVCHAPNGLADVEGGDGFLLYPGQSQYKSFYDAWNILGKGVTNNPLLTMNSNPALNHTGLQNWPATSTIYGKVKTLLTCWDQPAACTINPSPDSADLSVSMAGNNGQNNGGVIRYSITVANAGPTTANSLEITHQLPAQVTLSSVTPSSIAYTSDGGEVTLYLDSLAMGSSRSIDVIVNTATTNNATMDFTTSVSAVTQDTNLANNVSTQKFGGGVTSSSADLSVSMTGHNGKNQNGIINYAITVANAGPGAATSVEIVHQLPAQVTLGTVAPSSIDYTENGDETTFYIDSLAAGTSRSIDISVNTAANNKTKMDFSASVSAATTDTKLANNSSTARFGGSFGWLFIVFSGLILMARIFNKALTVTLNRPRHS